MVLLKWTAFITKANKTLDCDTKNNAQESRNPLAYGTESLKGLSTESATSALNSEGPTHMAPLHARTSYSCSWHQDVLACPFLPFLLERFAVTASTLILMNRAFSGRNSQTEREERSRGNDITARWCSWWQHQRELSWRGKMGTNDFNRLSKSPDLQACLVPVREEHAHSRSSQILSCPHHGLWWLGFPVPIHNMSEFIWQQWFLAQHFEMMELFIMTETWLPNWLLRLCHWLSLIWHL